MAVLAFYIILLTLLQQNVAQQQNFLLGVAEVGALQDQTQTQCGRELEALLAANAAQALWSVKVLDSFGTLPRSFAWGNYFWFSARELCEDLNAPLSITLQAAPATTHFFNISSPFPLRLTMIYLNFSTPYYIDLKLPYENLIHVGLCLPLSCAPEALSRYTATYFQQQVFQTQQKFALQMQVVAAKVPHIHWNFLRQTGSILNISFCVLFILLMVAAELAHSPNKASMLKQNKHQEKRQGQTTEIAPHDRFHDVTLAKLLACFRLSENFKRTIQLEAASNERQFLGVIAGLRTVICLWVTIFHVYYYSLYAVANASMIFAKLEYFILQPILQACFYVDVFFVISAFLLVYNFLSNEQQMQQIQQNTSLQNLKLFLKMTIQRYMR